MKKHLFIMLSIISMHAYAMEMEVKSTDPIIDLLKYSTEILDLIAQFLPFHDYETEEEFIERTQTLTIKNIPQEYHFKFALTNIKYSAYSPDNAIIAVAHEIRYMLSAMKKLTIINRKNNQQQTHILNQPYFKLAISCDGNLIATIDSTFPCVKYVVTITNFCTDKKEFCDIPLDFFKQYNANHPAIAFNKQGTNIIAHAKESQYIIFPLTVNTPNPNADNQKTLAKYFAQRGICKNLTEQIPHMKYLNNK